MAEIDTTFAFSEQEAAAAAERWSGRRQHHEQFEEAVRNKQYSKLDSPRRRVARAKRLLGRLQEMLPDAAAALAFVPEMIAKEAAAPHADAEAMSDALLERVIGVSRDFLFIEFLEQALYASRSIGRIVTKVGTRIGYGTGFMISSRLLLTNHHVLPSPEHAARSKVEFDYQRNRLGREIDCQAFQLDPASFFINDKELDFALVAVNPNGGEKQLASYGWCPLIKEEGKIVAGEPINIVQHPKGELKQIVIRENRLIDILERHAHYEADTEPGSSGSPVFNDQWEVVALHHSGVPKTNERGEWLRKDGGVWQRGDDTAQVEWVANEGIRVSRIVAFLTTNQASGSKPELLKEALDALNPVEPTPEVCQDEPSIPVPKDQPPMPPKPTATSATLTVPLHITFSLGTAAAGATLRIGNGDDADEPTFDQPPEALLERVEIDPDYSNRKGFDRNFLGFKVPFPTLTSATRPRAFALPGLFGDKRFELKYHHYSVIFNKARKLAFVAGVNYDPTAKFHHKRDKKDEWFYDPRVEPEEDLQAGEALYAGNPLDRGHLVRRADAGWGQTKKEAKLANDDTFHFTNCSPQHAITNQGHVSEAPPGLKLWGKLEDHIASQGKKNKRKLCIFNGPVFRSSDDEYRDIKIPKEFWKVVVFANDSGQPAAAAFVLTQAELIEDLEEEFEVGEYKAVQVRVKDLESKIKLDFGAISGWDVLEQPGAEEHFTGESTAVVLESVEDMVL